LLIISVTLSSSTVAQVIEGAQFMSKGTFNALTINLPEGSEKDAPKEWVKFFKEYGKLKKDKKTEEYFADDAKIIGMSANAVDVYTKFNGNSMTVWFDLGGAYLNSSEHTAGYPVGEQLLTKFALHLQVLLVEEELKKEEKALKDRNGELSKLEGKKADLEKNIADWKAKIAQAEKDIEQNALDQEGKKAEIQQQQTVLETVRARLAKLKS
jgi:uncharacterized protein (DUF342 family)